MKTYQIIFFSSILFIFILVPSLNAQEKITSTFSDLNRIPLEQFENELKQFDQKNWSLEILAQEHEATFVYLWDELLKPSDNYEVFEKFYFKELFWGAPSERNTYENGVTKTMWRGVQNSVQRKDWPEFLKKLKKTGYEIEQTEWHHESFHLDEKGNGHSSMAIVLHVKNDAKKYRNIIKGVIRIEWSQDKDEYGYYKADKIFADHLEMIETSQAVKYYTLMLQMVRLPFSANNPILVHDLDGNGFAEIILPGSNQILWNSGNEEFKATLLFNKPLRLISAALIAEVTMDGIPDLIIAQKQQHPKIFAGSIDGNFNSEPIPINIPNGPLYSPSVITAGDLDSDGDLDLFFAQYDSTYSSYDGWYPHPYYDANNGLPSTLMFNQGNGVFVGGTQYAGLQTKRYRRTYSSSFIDLDRDGDLDLLVVSDFAGVDIYSNNGKAQFEDVTRTSVDEKSNFGMAHTFGDFNMDGNLDFYVTGMSSNTARRLYKMNIELENFPDFRSNLMPMAYGSRIYLGRHQSGRFEQFLYQDQLARSGWSWGTSSFDFDNDGDLDIYVGNGFMSSQTAKDYCTKFWRRDLYLGTHPDKFLAMEYFRKELRKMNQEGLSWNGFEHNRLYLNKEGKEFLDIAYLTGTSFEYDTRSVLVEDLGLDGGADLILSDRFGNVYVYRQLKVNDNNWIGVRLEERPGLSTIGARITVEYAGNKQFKDVVVGDSHHAQHSNNFLFGLKNHKKVERIIIQWVDGAITEIKNPKIRQYHTGTPSKSEI